MKILIVDDSKAMRMIVKRTLRQAGLGDHETQEAGDGTEALPVISSWRPDLVLSDWNMPEMNGIEFVAAVRGRPEYDAVRIVMVTTETDMGRMTEALSRGANEYVMKPFTRDIILQKLELLGMAVA
jgi:two-component system chemotaxis response regulator CheY